MQKYKLDWKMKLIFWFMSRGPGIAKRDLQKTRAQFNSKSLPALTFRRAKLTSVQDRSIPGRQGAIPVRIYQPVVASDLPVIVYFHGGGFVLGGLNGHDGVCRRLAVENKALVVSVDYRLAPEHKFPAAVEDSYDATCWVADHLAELGTSSDRLIVAGDSAGGNLAAVVSLMARDLNGPRISFQILIYPAVELSENFPSKQLYTDTPVLDAESMIFFRDMYVNQPADCLDPHVSPLLADHLTELPPALVLTAEYDPLRDEGKAYADRLRQSGNDATYVCYPGMVHGFVSFGWLGSQTKAAFDQIHQSIQRVSVGAINS